VTFSVVSHRQGPLVGHLLDDLGGLEFPPGVAHDVIVTLNVEEDEAFLASHRGPRLRVLRNEARRGFGANHNAAFAISSGEIFVVLNPDIRLPDFTLGPMLESLARPAVGAWAPLVLSATGTTEDSARRFPTIGRLLGRTLPSRRVPDYPSDAGPVAVDWVAGMFVAVRRETFASLGGFDERFFMYMEDVDLCRRMGQEGLEVVYDPRTSVIHDARRASRRSLRHSTWHVRSAVRYLFGI
jgi:GT2 family glycosyltransferase